MDRIYSKSEVLKENSFPRQVLKDKASYKKAYTIKNHDTLKINMGMIVAKVKRDIK